jgi:hypothetical protein
MRVVNVIDMKKDIFLGRVEYFTFTISLREHKEIGSISSMRIRIYSASYKILRLVLKNLDSSQKIELSKFFETSPEFYGTHCRCQMLGSCRIYLSH